MKLLFDQNLSFKLCRLLADLFPGSDHVRLLGLSLADDRTIWEYAKGRDFVIVTHDSDFADLASLLGVPPKVVWLRTGNQTTGSIEAKLRLHSDALALFATDVRATTFEVY